MRIPSPFSRWDKWVRLMSRLLSRFLFMKCHVILRQSALCQVESTAVRSFEAFFAFIRRRQQMAFVIRSRFFKSASCFRRPAVLCCVCVGLQACAPVAWNRAFLCKGNRLVRFVWPLIVPLLSSDQHKKFKHGSTSHLPSSSLLQHAVQSSQDVSTCFNTRTVCVSLVIIDRDKILFSVCLCDSSSTLIACRPCVFRIRSLV